MPQILIISGSPRSHGDGYKIIQLFMERVSHKGDIQYQIIHPTQEDIHFCKGCLTCFRKTISDCPIHDAMPDIRALMAQANGLIFVTPVYLHSYSAGLKLFFDRMCYAMHKPCFHGIPSMHICTTELSGIDETLEAMRFPVQTMGFTILGELGVFSHAYKHSEVYKQQVDAQLSTLADEYYKQIIHPTLPRPRFQDLVVFTKLKTKIILHKDRYPGDYAYWLEKEWFDKPYFYDTPINPIHQFVVKRMVKPGISKLKKKMGGII